MKLAAGWKVIINATPDFLKVLLFNSSINLYNHDPSCRSMSSFVTRVKHWSVNWHFFGFIGDTLVFTLLKLQLLPTRSSLRAALNMSAFWIFKTDIIAGENWSHIFLIPQWAAAHKSLRAFYCRWTKRQIPRGVRLEELASDHVVRAFFRGQKTQTSSINQILSA